jgi:hypothetical protein
MENHPCSHLFSYLLEKMKTFVPANKIKTNPALSAGLV